MFVSKEEGVILVSRCISGGRSFFWSVLGKDFILLIGQLFCVFWGVVCNVFVSGGANNSTVLQVESCGLSFSYECLVFELSECGSLC